MAFVLDSRTLTDEQILTLIERSEDLEVPNTEQILGTELEEADEAFIEEDCTDPLLNQPEQQLPCELILGPKSNESDDSGRGSGDMPICDTRSRNRFEMEEKGVVGLMNIGNSCYMNAGLQCLLNTPALVEYFGTRPYNTLTKPKSSRAKLLLAFGLIFNKVWGPDQPDNALKLSVFKFHLSECHSVFKGSSQQDCQEFITLLLDTLDELLKAINLRRRKQLIEVKNDLPGSSALTSTDLAGSLPSSSTVKRSKSPFKLSSIPNRRIFLPNKVRNAMKSVNVLPELSIFKSVPKFVDSKITKPGGDENEALGFQGLLASGALRFAPKKPKSAQDSPPAKRVRLETETEPTSRSRQTTDFGIQELKISDDEDVQRVPEFNENSKRVPDESLNPMPGLSSKSRRMLEKAAGISAQVGRDSGHGQRVQTVETEPSSVITKAFEGALTRKITCEACNHSTFESEPFKSLTLPIPRDAERHIRIIFVSIYDVNLPQPQLEYNLTFRLSQTVKDIKEFLINSFAKPQDVGQLKKLDDLVMTYTWDHDIHEFLPDDCQVRYLNETKSLYLFEVNSDFTTGFDDLSNGHNDLSHGCNDPSNSHSDLPHGHSDLHNSHNGPNRSPPSQQDFSVDFEASTFVLDEDATILSSEICTKNNESVSCEKCWEIWSRDKVRVNVECECVLCLECIEVPEFKEGKVAQGNVCFLLQELTRKSTGTYKCPQCTQKVAFKSLCPIVDNVLKIFKIVFMNETCDHRFLFGCPMLLKLPSKLLAQDLRQYFDAVGIGLRSDRYDILLLNYSPQSCVMCGPDSHCPGCPLSISGLVFLPEATTIVIRFFELLPQDMEILCPKSMAVGRNVDFDPDYTYEPAFLINDCLDLFTTKEKLEHERFCKKCGKNQEAVKSLAISHCPDYFILNVERHGFGISQKLENPIEFNLKLDLSKYVAPECAQSAKYELYGIVCHSGGASYGHYTSFVKNPWTLQWYFCDDSKVVQQEPDQSIYSSAYILFWHREGITLKSNLEFARCRPKTPPPPLRTYSPVILNNSPAVRNDSPAVVNDSPPLRNASQAVRNESSRARNSSPAPSSSGRSRPLGLSRRKQSQSVPQAPHKPKTLFENKDTYSPTRRNEILADFYDVDEAEESRKMEDDDDSCISFIGRHDHLPYYSGMPSNVMNGGIDPNITYTLDSDPLQVDPWG